MAPNAGRIVKAKLAKYATPSQAVVEEILIRPGG
jgi:hypothetical protein